MKLSSHRHVFLWGLLVSGLVWLGLVLFVPSARQSKVWYLEGREYLSDYFMPRATAAHANPYRDPARTQSWSLTRSGFVQTDGWDLPACDRAYPAGALLPLVPFADSLGGARVCNVVMIACFLIVLMLCLWNQLAGRAILAVCALWMSGPMLFAYERGNPIWWALGGVLVFLLYWDHPRKSLRFLAAAGLAVAASIKVMPALLGLVYVTKFTHWKITGDDLKMPCACVILGVLFFALPWFFVSGWDSFGDWWLTGHANVAFYAPRSTFGFVGLYRTVCIAFNQPWAETTGFHIARNLTILLGLAMMAYALGHARRNRYAFTLMITASMLFLSSNMRPYTALYLLPSFILWLKDHERDTQCALLESLAWYVIWTPLQIPFGSVQLYPLQNIALFVLLLVGWRAKPSCAS